MNYKFSKTIGTVEFFGKTVENIIVCSAFQYFPEKKEMHLQFTNLLYDKKSDTVAYNNKKVDTHYINIIGEDVFNRHESTLLESGLLATIDALYQEQEKMMLLKFGILKPEDLNKK